MSCISEFAKYVLLLLSFLIGVCSLVLIVFGIEFLMNEYEGVNVFFTGTDFSFGYIVIGVGVIILFIAGFGCFGTLHENTCLLTTFAIFLLILFAIQVALGVFTILKVVKEDDFFSFVKDALTDLFSSTEVASIKAFYKIQTQFKCCGVNNSTDYVDANYPKSCCGRTPCYMPYEQGCVEAFIDATKEYIEIIGYVAIGFAVVEFAGAMFSFMLRRENIRSQLKLAGHKAEETSI